MQQQFLKVGVTIDALDPTGVLIVEQQAVTRLEAGVLG
jgi:hypothetical protein